MFETPSNVSTVTESQHFYFSHAPEDLQWSVFYCSS